VPGPLSIVIPSHHRADLLANCLATVQRHVPVGTEVLVVDDGSPDAVVSRVASAARVRVLRLPQQRGFCVAANEGLRHVSGTFVELLNDDTEVSAGWAEAALAVFADPVVAAVAPLVLQGPARNGTPRIDSAGDRYFLGGVAGKRCHGAELRPDDLRPARVFGASASSAFYRREVVLQVGAFPESFGAYFEDVDLSFRLHRAGYDLRFEPASRVWHHGAASHGPPRRRLLEQQSRNEELVFWRNLPARTLLRALPQHLAVVTAKAARRWREGTLRPFLTGRLRVLAELPELVRHRCSLPAPARGVQHWIVEQHFWDAF
jgi:GT2 family glycosyltransferase